MDTKNLLKALDDDTNEALMNFTTQQLREMILKILKELQLPRNETIDLMKKLKDYKYVDEMKDLKYGTYLRWISINDPEDIQLTKGGIFCEMKVKEDGVYIICKNYGYNRKHFQIKLDENLIFQKLTEQELVLLSALDHLSK
jgi:transcriptional accessory protein Tex/SPT6